MRPNPIAYVRQVRRLLSSTRGAMVIEEELSGHRVEKLDARGVGRNEEVARREDLRVVHVEVRRAIHGQPAHLISLPFHTLVPNMGSRIPEDEMHSDPIRLSGR